MQSSFDTAKDGISLNASSLAQGFQCRIQASFLIGGENGCGVDGVDNVPALRERTHFLRDIYAVPVEYD